MHGAIPSLFHMPSWHAEGQLYFYCTWGTEVQYLAEIQIYHVNKNKAQHFSRDVVTSLHIKLIVISSKTMFL